MVGTPRINSLIQIFGNKRDVWISLITSMIIIPIVSFIFRTLTYDDSASIELNVFISFLFFFALIFLILLVFISFRYLITSSKKSETNIDSAERTFLGSFTLALLIGSLTMVGPVVHTLFAY